MALAGFAMPAARAQPDAASPKGIAVEGRVADAGGRPVAGATVRLERLGAAGSRDTKTDAAGGFAFAGVAEGSYRLTAENAGKRSQPMTIAAAFHEDGKRIELVLEDSGANSKAESGAASTAPPMEFADKPNFTVAGVVDWTAVGGHGSDATLRTSEALSRETLTLKAEGDAPAALTGSEASLKAALAGAPESFRANSQMGEFYLQAGRFHEAIAPLAQAYRIAPAHRGNEYSLALALLRDGDPVQARAHVARLLAEPGSADAYRLAGEIDEKLGDPLAAVHEFEQAVRLDPSEQNEFEWGSDLLLHRAVWQARDVFEKGAAAYPKSARMRAALGTALFAGARYEEAAARLCEASDLEPADPEPYLFLGKIEMAAPGPLACVAERLKRYADQQPRNALARYLYAMAILKGQEQSPDAQALQQAEALLSEAVGLDSKCAGGYLQLGILAASRRDLAAAIGYYAKAIEADPQLGDAHYRLAVAYDRMGEPAKARQEFALHDEIEKRQADAIEEQRREVKQFLVVLDQSAAPSPSR